MEKAFGEAAGHRAQGETILELDFAALFQSDIPGGESLALTCREILDIAARQGVSERQARKRLQDLVRRGEVEATEKVGLNMAGRTHIYPAYRRVGA